MFIFWGVFFFFFSQFLHIAPSINPPVYPSTVSIHSSIYYLSIHSKSRVPSGALNGFYSGLNSRKARTWHIGNLCSDEGWSTRPLLLVCVHECVCSGRVYWQPAILVTVQWDMGCDHLCVCVCKLRVWGCWGIEISLLTSHSIDQSVSLADTWPHTLTHTRACLQGVGKIFQ